MLNQSISVRLLV